VDASFEKIVENTIGKGGTLIGLMGDFEARRGALGIYGNIVWTKMDVSGDSVHTRRFDPLIAGGIATSHSIGVQMAIAEGGAVYEVASFGLPHGGDAPIPTAINLVAGARYWYQQANVSFNRSGPLLVLGARCRSAPSRRTRLSGGDCPAALTHLARRLPHRSIGSGALHRVLLRQPR
jgi:hypothetical protein